MSGTPKHTVEIVLDPDACRFLQGTGDDDTPFTNAKQQFREHLKPWAIEEIHRTPAARVIRGMAKLVSGLLKVVRKAGG